MRIVNEEATFVEFSSAFYSVIERQTPVQAELTFSRAGNLADLSQVVVSVTGGDAESGLDYNNLPQLVSFAPGETSATLLVDILPDQLEERTENINLEITNVGDVIIGSQNSATLRIADENISFVEFSEANYLAEEGDTLNQAELTFNRAGNLANSSQVVVNVTGGSAELGEDYNLPQLVSFAPGETSATLLVDILPDDLSEGAEEISLEVTNVGDVIIGSQNSATVSITDDDISFVEFAQASYSVRENSLITQAELIFNRTGDINRFSEVLVNVVGGSAQLGVDYGSFLGFPGLVSFAPGETTSRLFVDIFPDNLQEGIEEATFEVISLDDVVIGSQSTANLEIGDISRPILPPVITPEWPFFPDFPGFPGFIIA